MGWPLRLLTLTLLFSLGVGCKSQVPDNRVKKEVDLPAYRGLGGALYVFEPARSPQPIKNVNLHDLSYAYTYNMFHFGKDTLWKRQQAAYLARHAGQVVKEEFPEITVLPASQLEGKSYIDIMHARAYPASRYGDPPPDLKAQIRGLLVPGKNWLQLFIETSTYNGKDGNLHTGFTVRVFNTRSLELVYYDNLAFSLDFRDTKTWRRALSLMLQRLKENSAPPAGTRAGQNRR